MRDILIFIIPIFIIITILYFFIKSRKLESRIDRTLFFINYMKNDKKIDTDVAMILMASLIEDDFIEGIIEYAEETNDLSEK